MLDHKPAIAAVLLFLLSLNCLDLTQTFGDKTTKVEKVVRLEANGKRTPLDSDQMRWKLEVPAYGLQVLEVSVRLENRP